MQLLYLLKQSKPALAGIFCSKSHSVAYSRFCFARLSHFRKILKNPGQLYAVQDHHQQITMKVRKLAKVKNFTVLQQVVPSSRI